MKTTLLTIATLVGSLSTLNAAALTVDPAPLDVLRAEADAVVHGVVVATEAVADRDAPRVSTAVTLAVWQVLDPPQPGGLGERLTFMVPGGERGRLRTVAPGVPRPRPGDELVVLLERTPSGWRPLGYALGTLFVGDDGALRRAASSGRPGPPAATDAQWLAFALGVRR